MAGSEHVAGRPGAALNWAAGMVAMAGLAALGVGIGTGCTLLLAAACAVIFVAGLVPAFVEWRDSILRYRTAVRAGAGERRWRGLSLDGRSNAKPATGCWCGSSRSGIDCIERRRSRAVKSLLLNMTEHKNYYQTLQPRTAARDLRSLSGVSGIETCEPSAINSSRPFHFYSGAASACNSSVRSS